MCTARRFSDLKAAPIQLHAGIRKYSTQFTLFALVPPSSLSASLIFPLLLAINPMNGNEVPPSLLRLPPPHFSDYTMGNERQAMTTISGENGPHDI